MSIRTQRIILAVLALSAAYVGLWAEIAPASWYASFPGFGRHWLTVEGPYNEHLARDTGGLYLALLSVTIWAIVRSGTEIVRLTAVAWLVFSLPHLAFHLEHLAMLAVVDRIGNVVTLGGTVVLAGLLLARVTEPRAVSSSSRTPSSRKDVKQ